MPWTERQRAMLREMGIRVWAPAAGEAQLPSETADEVATLARVEPAAERPVARAPGDADAPARGAGDGAATKRLPGLALADWLVVAEPLDPADPQQEQLLENLLRAVGVAWVAPDRERRAAFFALAGADEAARPRSDVQGALATVAPRCVLAFGRAAALALLDDTDAPLGALRGRLHRQGGAAPVVVTLSLAFLLRHPAEKAKAWADLCLAAGALEPAAP